MMPPDPEDPVPSSGSSPGPHPRTMATMALQEMRAATLFLTRLPVGWSGDFPDSMQGRSQAWFPLVGALVGIVGGIVLAAVWWLSLPPIIAALFAVAAQMLLTGALHEDGLADVADGFGGGATRERKLEIMRDSQVGSYGVLALVLSVGLRTTAIAALVAPPHGPATAFAALVVAGAASRAAILPVASLLPPARRDGVAATSGGPTPTRLAAALGATALLALIALGPGAALTALTAAAAAVIVLALIARHQVGGYTGDVFGAVQQVAEIAALTALIAAAAV